MGRDDELDAVVACDVTDAGRTSIRGLGMPAGRSSNAGRAVGAMAFMASERAGGAIVRAEAAAGRGLPGAAEEEAAASTRGRALTAALAGVAAEAAVGADLVGAADGPPAGADALALLMSGTIVAFEAGLSLDVWSMTKS